MSSTRAEQVNADHGSQVQVGDRHTHYYGDSQHIFWQAEKLDKALFNSARENDHARAVQILEKGPASNADTCRDLGGMTALHWAVEHNNLEMAKLLVEGCGAWVDIPRTTVYVDPDDKDTTAYRQFLVERQHTPLFSALLHQRQHGHGPKMVQYLLDQGCSLTKVVYCVINEIKTWHGYECRDVIDAIIRCAEGKASETPSLTVDTYTSASTEDPFGDLVAKMLSAKRHSRPEASMSKVKEIDWLWRQNQVTIRGDIRSLNIMETWVDRYLTLGASESKSRAALQLLRLLCSTLPSSELVPALRPAVNYYFDRIGFAGSWTGYPVGSEQDMYLAMSLLFAIVALRQGGAEAMEAHRDFDQLRVRELWIVADGHCRAKQRPQRQRVGGRPDLRRGNKGSSESSGPGDIGESIQLVRRERILNVLKGLFRELGYDLEAVSSAGSLRACA